ncbi:MAG TPA: adenylate/guanylate cyclase domain-containing protein [Rhizomicrobium sp.]|nr:adenylate/guanylate cyclase domain-containing protein [Rhizomicrobium sp.]
MASTDTASFARALAEQPVSRSTGRRPLFALVVLALLGLLCTPLFVNRVAHNAPHPVAGEVSFASWGELTAPVDLGGEWMLHWHGDSVHPADERIPIKVPGPWKGLRTKSGETLPESGFGTYELTIRDLPPGQYLFHAPIIDAGTRIWIDGQVVSAMGVVGNSPETTRYMVRSQDVPFVSTGAPVHIAIDIAAFFHRDNGLEAAPVVGLAGPMRSWASLKWGQDFLFRVSLLLLVVYGFVVFVFRPSDRASLYFALSCLFFLPIASVDGYDSLIMIALPGLSFPARMAIQYLPANLAAGFFVAYANALFPKESPRILYFTLLLGFACMFVAHSVLLAAGNTLVSSHVSRYDTLWGLVSFAYIVAVVAVATFRRRDGALIFLLGVAIFTGSFSLDALIANDVMARDQGVGIDLTPLGVLMLLFSHIVILAERWSVAIRAAEEMTVDLRRLIDVSSSITAEIHLGTLLRKIVEATSKFLHADRSSLFLYDAKTHELIATVAEGVETKQIRFDAKLGLAGHSFMTGSIINVEDAYKDPRFNRDVDDITGYRTRSVLTMPVTARDGRRLGVMQALNRRDAKSFDTADIARMSAFAAQAAIAIDNATLFSEVVSARNYNESILRSMSNGVITFDSDTHIAKVNAAAAAIFEIDAEAVVGLDAKDLLGGGANAWMLDELNAIRGDHQPRSFLDVDVRTATGKTISANISVVPLVGEAEAAAGLLILIEDISDEKRMEGAMRRFMTQKVVDQVLQRQDELLFGTSCIASVLFADIRSFTTMAEALTARETVDMLNEIFTELVDAVSSTDGVLDKFMGDAVMAVFGAPLSSGRDPANAVDCAIGMMTAQQRINLRRRERGLAELRLGIGVSTGDVIAGTIGSPKRMDYTVIGDSVNLASRLQTLTKTYRVSIIVCETTSTAVGANHVLRELDVIRVRGRQRPEKIYQLLTYHTEKSFPNLRAVLAAYARGRGALAKRDWTGAIAAFEEAVRLNPADYPSQLMLERSRVLMKSPPAAGWDGVWSDGAGAG